MGRLWENRLLTCYCIANSKIVEIWWGMTARTYCNNWA